MEAAAANLFIGKKLIHLNEVDSTNTYLKTLCENEILPEGTVVIAESQYAGRGQRSNTWESEPGKNIIMSLIFYPGFLSANRQFLLSQAVALALQEFISNLLPEEKTSIKWPNDIYVGDKKIAGILIESSWMGNQVKNSIVGIGININQDGFYHPNAISLKMIMQSYTCIYFPALNRYI